MPTFRYKARDRQGQIVSGVQEAENKEKLLSGLKTIGYTPLAVQPEKSNVAGASRPGIAGQDARPTNVRMPSVSNPRIRGNDRKTKSPSLRGGKVNDTDLLMFTRELESVVRSGMPILAGLRALGNQAEQATLRKTLQTVSGDIEAGLKLSEALKKHPKVFSDVYVTSIMAGESSGQLAEVLKRLSALLENQIETKAGIMTATRYPIIVLCVLFGAFMVIVNFVLPRFADFYSKLDAELPLPTLLLMAFGRFVHQFWLLIMLCIGLSIAALLWYIQTPPGRFMKDTLNLKWPIFGPLFKKIEISRFASTLETLYSSGVPIVEAFTICSKVVGNVIVGRALINVREGITSGEQIAVAMQRSALFPPLVIQMIASGEQTGNLDQHLRDIASHYDHQIKYTTKNLTTLIEPILTVLLGGMVLMFALAIFMPMWKMISILKR